MRRPGIAVRTDLFGPAAVRDRRPTYTLTGPEAPPSRGADQLLLIIRRRSQQRGHRDDVGVNLYRLIHKTCLRLRPSPGHRLEPVDRKLRPH